MKTTIIRAIDALAHAAIWLAACAVIAWTLYGFLDPTT
jgi:hypothetical protein